MGNHIVKCLDCFPVDKLIQNLSAPDTVNTIENEQRRLGKEEKIAQFQKDEKETLVSVTIPFFPREIIFEILSWLPVKHLLRLRCVCKEWYALTQDRLFIKVQFTRHTDFETYIHNISIDNNNEEPFNILATCNGLLLFQSSASGRCLIRNPATCQRLNLPNPHNISFDTKFCFIPSTGGYKLVSVFEDRENLNNQGAEILTVGKDDTWRFLKFPNRDDLNKTRLKLSVVLAGGAVHCLRIIQVGSNIYEEVVSIDLETELITSTSLPHGSFLDWKKVWTFDWDGRPSLAYTVEDDLNVLVLENYKQQKWGQVKKIVPLKFLKENPDTRTDLAFFYAPLPCEIWIKLGKGEKWVCYNAESKKITHTTKVSDSSPEHYIFRPSLVSLKGMQPEMQQPPVQTGFD